MPRVRVQTAKKTCKKKIQEVPGTSFFWCPGPPFFGAPGLLFRRRGSSHGTGPPRDTHGASTGHPRDTHGAPTGHPRDTHGAPTGHQQDPHGTPTEGRVCCDVERKLQKSEKFAFIGEKCTLILQTPRRVALKRIKKIQRVARPVKKYVFPPTKKHPGGGVPGSCSNVGGHRVTRPIFPIKTRSRGTSYPANCQKGIQNGVRKSSEFGSPFLTFGNFLLVGIFDDKLPPGRRKCGKKGKQRGGKEEKEGEKEKRKGKKRRKRGKKKEKEIFL